MLQIIFGNHLFAAVFGWTMYIVFMFSFTKGKQDRKKKKFNYKEFWYENWDNWLFAALLILVITQYAPEIWQWFNYATKEDMPFSDLVYLGVGPLAEGIHFLISWIILKAGVVLKALKTPTPEG